MTTIDGDSDYSWIEMAPTDPIGVADVKPSRRHLPVLTQSSITTFRRCPREYFLRYVQMMKPCWKSDALHFGTLFHVGLNAWWLSGQPFNTPPAMRIVEAIAAMHGAAALTSEIDAFTLAKAEALLIGYTARWGGEDLETVAVERRFEMPLLLDAFELRGSIDAIAKSAKGLFNVEHKTTRYDISPGSDYWRHVIALDPQVSTYNAAAKALGYDVRGTIYDVIRKPEIVPLKATPEELRKYTKPTKAEPRPRLYANQRETDETVEEYRDRLVADIIARPNWYFARTTVVRLERDEEEHARDVVDTARMIRFAEEHDAWPRSPNACERYRRLCEFFPVCSGETSITDGTRYMKKAAQHEELT